MTKLGCVDKSGRVVKMIGGCAKDGKNAQSLSAEIAKLLKTQEAKIVAVGGGTK